MLQKNSDSISYVCTQVGFESLGSFSTLFKKRNGVSPLEYRNVQMERQKDMNKEPRKYIPHCLLSHFSGE